MERKCLRINDKDNVAMLLEDGQKGDYVEIGGMRTDLLEDIEFAHKILLCDLKQGDPVIKYGEEIGRMLTDAPRGTWIHNHNMGCERGTK